MKILNLTTLILLTSVLCLFKVSAQDVILFNINDSIPLINKCVSSSENYYFGLSSQLIGTSKLNTISSILIVIDGIPYPDRTTDELDYTTADLNDIAQLAHIPLESIEAVELLDYSPGTLLYGSDARNGVLSIITKNHSSNKLHVNYSYSNTFSKQPKSYEMLSGDNYPVFMMEALFNPRRNEHTIYNRALLYDPTWSEYENFNNNTNWQNAITQSGFNQEHYLSLSGQTNKLGYQLAAGYSKGKGTMRWTSNEEYSIHLNLSYQPIEMLTANFNINYSNIQANSYNTYSSLDLYEGALKKMPNMSIYESKANGTFTSEYYVPTIEALVYDGNYTNPVHYANISSQNDINKILNPTFNLELTPINGLKYKLATSIIKKQYDLGLHDLPMNYAYRSSYNGIGEYATYLYKTNTLYLTNAINYYLIQNNSNQLMLSATHSINTRKSETDYEAVNYEGNYKYGSNNHNELKNQNITGSVNYSALNRCFVNVGVYTEVSKSINYISKYESTYFGKGYALNAKWAISNESFFKPLDFIDYLSIAASINNHNIPISDAFDEKQQDVCFKTHLQLLNKFSFNVNYFERELKNQVIDSHYFFKHNILNKGWELNTKIALIDQEDFKIAVFGHLHKNTLQITEANYDLNDGFYYTYTNGNYLKRGEYDKIYGFNYNGVYQYNDYIEGTQENAPVARDSDGNIILDSNGNPAPMIFAKGVIEYQFLGGDAIYEDINHDGNIDENDIQQIGNARPKITGTGGTSLQYKGWWLGVFFNFRYGNDIVNRARMDLENMYTYNNQTTAVNYRWRNEGDQTHIPRALYKYGYNWLGSTRFVEDGSFFRLKTITLRYQIPEKIISKLHLSNLSLYITGKNLFTMTDYQGADPDISLNTTWDTYGYDDNYNAAIKQWIFGINVSL